MLAADRLDAVLNAIRGGSDLDTACHYAGLSSAVIGRMLERGMIASQLEAGGQDLDEEQAENLRVWNEITKARADAVVRNVTLIQKAAQDGSWQAAAWWLERAVPGQYGRKSSKLVEPSEKQREITEQ